MLPLVVHSYSLYAVLDTENVWVFIRRMKIYQNCLFRYHSWDLWLTIYFEAECHPDFSLWRTYIFSLFCGFQKSTVRAKYLGVPLDRRKMTVEIWMLLTDKITSRMKHRSSKLLSYAGRVQLIKSVILSIITYWLHISSSPEEDIEAHRKCV